MRNNYGQRKTSEKQVKRFRVGSLIFRIIRLRGGSFICTIEPAGSLDLISFSGRSTFVSYARQEACKSWTECSQQSCNCILRCSISGWFQCTPNLTSKAICSPAGTSCYRHLETIANPDFSSSNTSGLKLSTCKSSSRDNRFSMASQKIN